MFYAARRDAITGAEQPWYAAFQCEIELLGGLLVDTQHDCVGSDGAFACRKTVGYDHLPGFDAYNVGMRGEDHAQRHHALHPGNDVMRSGQVVPDVPVSG